MLLMEHIFVSVHPVGVSLLVVRLLIDWFIFLRNQFHLLLFWLKFEILVSTITCRCQFHSMRIDNFCFFFKIECFPFLQYDCVSKFIFEFFLIARVHTLWIWITNKFVCASSVPATYITSNCV